MPLQNGLTVGRCRTRPLCLPDDYLLARRHGAVTVRDGEIGFETAGGLSVLPPVAGALPLGAGTLALASVGPPGRVRPTTGAAGPLRGSAYTRGRAAGKFAAGVRGMPRRNFWHGAHVSLFGLPYALCGPIYFVTLLVTWEAWLLAPIALSAAATTGYAFLFRFWHRVGREGGDPLLPWQRLAGRLAWFGFAAAFCGGGGLLLATLP